MKQLMLLMLVTLVVVEQGECVNSDNLNFMSKARKPCCAPPQFEGMIGGQVGLGNGQLITNIMSFAFDETKERSVMNGTQITNGQAHNFKILALYKSKRMYVVNGTTGECLYYPLGEFQRACVPAGAQHFGPIRIGVGRNSVLVDSWNIQVEEGSGSVSTTARKCVFTSQMTAGTMEYGKEKVGYLATYGFFDVNLGIKHPHVFIPPHNCKPGNKQEKLLKPFFL